MKIQALALVLFGTLLASSPAQGAAITVGNVKMRTQDGLKVKQIKGAPSVRARPAGDLHRPPGPSDPT